MNYYLALGFKLQLPHDYACGEGSEYSEGSIEGPPTFIEVYHWPGDNKIEVFPSISSQIMYSYTKDSLISIAKIALFKL